MDFMVDPAALVDLEHNLKVDERMLRYVLQKKDPLPRLPTTYKVSKLARALRERQQIQVRCRCKAFTHVTTQIPSAHLQYYSACSLLARGMMATDVATRRADADGARHGLAALQVSERLRSCCVWTDASINAALHTYDGALFYVSSSARIHLYLKMVALPAIKSVRDESLPQSDSI